MPYEDGWASGTPATLPTGAGDNEKETRVSLVSIAMTAMLKSCRLAALVEQIKATLGHCGCPVFVSAVRWEKTRLHEKPMSQRTGKILPSPALSTFFY
jgi:hypothetical protein